MTTENKITGIGIGTGDSEYLTIKAIRALKKCDVIFTPQPHTDKKSMAYQICEGYIQDNCAIIAYDLPMIKGDLPNYDAYQKIISTILELYVAGKEIGVLCEGDPSFYGSFQYIAKLLADQAPDARIEIIAGISSPNVAAALLQTPLGSRNQAYITIPATMDSAQIHQCLAISGAKTIIKIGKNFSKIQQILIERNLIAQSYLICKASLPDQEIIPLTQEIKPDSVPYFSLIFIKATHD